MTKTVIILNLLMALVLLPVAQAFVSPADFNSPQNTEQMDMSHCKNMNNGVCGEKSDCLASGMLCIDSLSSALLFDHNISSQPVNVSSVFEAKTGYNYLSLRSILRPPRKV